MTMFGTNNLYKWEKRFYRERTARKKAENLLEEKSLELYNLNTQLKKRVEKEVDKNNLQEKLLFEQSKMAAMGEMIEAIAHQWRQPLSVITTVASGMMMKKEYGLLSDETFIDSTDDIVTAAQHLSQTIDDFRDFFKPDKQNTLFNLKNSFFKAKTLLSSKFKNKEIKLVENIKDVQVNGLCNELIQVFMNILNNAKDALEELEKKEKKVIFIDIYQEGQNAIVKIKDNGGGIPQKLFDKIFESHFTTKGDKEGTGIGLYMTKQIIEDHLCGKIEIQNSTYDYEGAQYYGAEFKLTIPC